MPGITAYYLVRDGLIFSPEDIWKKQRALLSKSFNFEQLKSCFELIKAVTF